MTLLAWSEARPEDRAALQVFSCTTTAPAKSRATGWQVLHPKPWEYEAQGMLRRLKVPRTGAGMSLRLGRDDDGLAAASFWQELDGPAVVDWLVAGIACRLRGKGGGYADEMIEDTLDAITGAAIEAEVTEVLVTGRIFEENHASQALCRRAGFRHTGNTDAPGVQVWSLILLI